MEDAWLAELPNRLPVDPDAVVGVGDDAAVLRPPVGRNLIVTVDLLVDGVHFRADRHDPRAIGHKALGVNLSDVAAMGGVPRWAVVAVALPRRPDPAALVRALTEGMLPLARSTGTSIVGGDTNVHDGPLTVSVTVIGQTLAEPAWTRTGARPGDLLCVTGPCGGSLGGADQAGRHLAVVPRCAEAAWLAKHAEIHAACDVSDGLARDGWNLARGSGLTLVFEAAAIPIHSDAVREAQSSPNGPTALTRALSDGEDFELLLAITPAEHERLTADTSCPTLIPIGRFEPPVDGTPRLEIVENGRRVPLPPQGYRHGGNAT